VVPVDPVTAIITLIPFAITTVGQVEQLIARLQDHARTLKQAEADRGAADANFDATLADAPAVGDSAANEAAARGQAGE
jgi:hypothetical protein